MPIVKQLLDTLAKDLRTTPCDDYNTGHICPVTCIPTSRPAQNVEDTACIRFMREHYKCFHPKTPLGLWPWTFRTSCRRRSLATVSSLSSRIAFLSLPGRFIRKNGSRTRPRQSWMSTWWPTGYASASWPIPDQDSVQVLYYHVRQNWNSTIVDNGLPSPL